MTKKVKSFAVDEEIYEAVFSMFKQNYVDVNISYCLNKYLKELLYYFRAIEGELKKSSELDVPMSFIIESVAREPLFSFLESTPAPGMDESPSQIKVKEFQRKYDTEIKKYPEQAGKYNINAIDGNVPSSKFLKAIVKSVIEELTTLGKLPDDRYTEIVREAGGKGLQKKIREDIAPKFAKIDPTIKVKRSSKKQDKNNK